nr:MAG TPA: hypothetical protein [Caudoviricetes sp.]
MFFGAAQCKFLHLVFQPSSLFMKSRKGFNPDTYPPLAKA